MGFEPAYVFAFRVGRIVDGKTMAADDGRRIDAGPDLMTVEWVWRRIWDESLAPP